ncbi:MAG TPA: hypothetical protein VFK84_17040 [Burkholderiales bacterium]|nr:hypothetical protein [Burkholderiales bacterium]
MAVALVCAAAQAQDVPRPDVKAGDSWTFRRVDYESNAVSAVFVTRASFANDRVIQLVSNRQGDEKEIDSIFTAEWNQVSSANSGIFEPHQDIFRFPLRPGNTHEARYEVKFPQQGAYQVRHERKVRVVGWEELTVPAGRFRALRVESEGTFQRVDVSLAGRVKEVMWYVPEVKRYAKWTFENHGFRGRIQWWGFELVDYKVQ